MYKSATSFLLQRACGASWCDMNSALDHLVPLAGVKPRCGTQAPPTELQARARGGRGRRGLLQGNPWFYTTSATCEDKYSYAKTTIGCAVGEPPLVLVLAPPLFSACCAAMHAVESTIRRL